MPATAAPRAPMVLTLTQYLKTAEGVALIASQRLFSYEDRLWKGYEGSCIKVLDWQPVPSELDDCLDMDGTLVNVMTRIKTTEHNKKRRVDQELLEREGQKAKARMDALQAAKMQRDLGLEGSSLRELLSGEVDPVADESPQTNAPSDTVPLAEEDQYRVPPGLHPELTAVPEIEQAESSQRTEEKLDALINGFSAMNRTISALVETLTVQDVQARNVPVAVEVENEPEQEVDTEEPKPQLYPEGSCTVCGACPPQGHKNPLGWLRGHSMAKHRQRLA